MAFDTHSLFAYSTISSVTSQAGTTLIIVLPTGSGALFAVGQQVILAPASTLATLSNAMVGRVTGIASDTLTIDYGVGNREGSNIQTINTSYVVGNGVTPKALTDIETQTNTNTTAIAAGAAKLQTTTTAVDVSAAAAPSTGKILTATDSSHATWQTPTGTDGWISSTATLTYSSTDGHTFVVTTSVDLTALIGVGMKIKVTNQSATQYFFVTAITSGTMTLYGGTTYSLTATSITAPSYSLQRAPYGFPLNPNTWSEEYTNTSDLSQAAAVATTWYNVGSGTLAIPIGIWRVFYQAVAKIDQANSYQHYMTLSTGSSSASDADFTSYSVGGPNSSNAGAVYHKVEKVISLSSKTSYFLNLRSEEGAPTIHIDGTKAPTRIKAVCAYL